MQEEQSTSNSPEKASDLFESISKASVVLIAGLYGIGLLVTNAYLLSIGISDFSSLRPKYVVTGGWTAVLLFLSSAPYLIARDMLDSSKPNKWMRRGFVIMVAIFIVLMYCLIATDLLRVHNWVVVSVALESIFGTGFVCYFARYAGNRFKERSWKRLHVVWFLGPAIFLGSYTLLSSVGRKLYPNVPEGIGGGKPVEARLVLNANGTAFWNQTNCLPLNGKPAVTTAPVEILYQSEHRIVIKAPYDDGSSRKSKVIVLNDSLVDGILPEPEATFEGGVSRYGLDWLISKFKH